VSRAYHPKVSVNHQVLLINTFWRIENLEQEVQDQWNATHGSEQPTPPCLTLLKSTGGSTGKCWFHVVELDGSVSFLFATIRSHSPHLALFNSRREPCTGYARTQDQSKPNTFGLRMWKTRATHIMYSMQPRLKSIGLGVSPLVGYVLVCNEIGCLTVIFEIRLKFRRDPCSVNA
jgi:hypothetical protein